MEAFKFSRDIAQLAILQRIELSGSVLKKIRKLFGRYLFTNFFSKYLISVPIISDKYYNFEIYFDYFKQVSNDSTIIIFDTIRPEYFKNIFREMNVIKEDNDALQKSKRVACRILLR